MAAAAAQQAQGGQKAQKKPAMNFPQDDKKAGGGTLKDKLYSLPQAAGAAIMIVLLALALFAGNFRALQIATPKDFIRQGDVQSIIEDRIDAAENVLSVAGRLGLDANAVNAAESAMGELDKAKSAREISRADQALSAAIAELTTADLQGEDARSMMKAADSFAEQGSFLRQEARAYNEQAQKAEKVYERLPTKFLYDAPDMYEGI